MNAFQAVLIRQDGSLREIQEAFASRQAADLFAILACEMSDEYREYVVLVLEMPSGQLN